MKNDYSIIVSINTVVYLTIYRLIVLYFYMLYTIIMLKAKTDNNTGNAIFIKIGGLKNHDPYFFTQSKDEATGKYVEDKVFSEISGTPTKLVFTTKHIESENKDIEVFDLTMVDGEETYILQSGFTFAARSILNSIAGADSIGQLTIGLYRNKNGKTAVSMKNDNEKMDWALDSDAQKALTIEITHPKTGEVTSRDYDDLDAKLKELCSTKIAGNAVSEWADVQEETAVDLPFN